MAWNSVRMLLGLFAMLAIATPGAARPAAAASPGDQMIAQVNRVRSQHGLPTLEAAAHLETLAFERSADMAARRYFSHTTPEGVDVFGLMDQRGIRFQAAGENLAWNTYGEDQAAGFELQGFLNSPPHRDNLLNPAFSQVGVGVARDGAKTYFTLVFVG